MYMYMYLYIGGKSQPCSTGVISLWGIHFQDLYFFEVENTRYILGVWTRVLGAQMGPGAGPNFGPT